MVDAGLTRADAATRHRIRHVEDDAGAHLRPQGSPRVARCGDAAAAGRARCAGAAHRRLALRRRLPVPLPRLLACAAARRRAARHRSRRARAGRSPVRRALRLWTRVHRRGHRRRRRASAAWRIGQRVVVPWAISCGDCAPCGRRLTSQCDRKGSALAAYGFGGRAGGWGGMVSDVLRVPFADAMLVPVPDGVSPLTARRCQRQPARRLADGGAASARRARGPGTGRRRRRAQHRPLRRRHRRGARVVPGRLRRRRSAPASRSPKGSARIRSRCGRSRAGCAASRRRCRRGTRSPSTPATARPASSSRSARSPQAACAPPSASTSGLRHAAAALAHVSEGRPAARRRLESAGGSARRPRPRRAAGASIRRG